MDKSDFQDIINEYKEQVRVLRAQISELEDACKSKDAALKRSLPTEACATLPNKEHSCIKCYKQSGATLPFWDKYNKPTFKK